jgi:hypothetical protein
MTTPSLSQSLVAYMSALTYRAESMRLVSLMPLSGIYWDDEIPDLTALFSLGEDDKMQYLRLFAIRIRLWRGEALNGEDQNLWDTARTQVPTCPVFMRLNISEDDRKIQREAEEETDEMLGGLFSGAEEVTWTDVGSGAKEFTAKLDFTEERQSTRRSSFWRRVFNKNDQ